MRRPGGVRWQRSPTPGTCTKRHDVHPTGISGKVARLTLGGLVVCHSATGVERRREGPSDVSQGHSKGRFTSAPRAEHEEPRVGDDVSRIDHEDSNGR